jgi:hypothetical protein
MNGFNVRYIAPFQQLLIAAEGSVGGAPPRTSAAYLLTVTLWACVGGRSPFVARCFCHHQGDCHNEGKLGAEWLLPATKSDQVNLPDQAARPVSRLEISA